MRLTLAHELGHLVMHEHPTEDMEREADRFAAEFLMPEQDVALELYPMSLERAAALKTRWRVSMAALIRRARDLGKLTTWQYKNLFVQLGRLGYRTNEPNPIAFEEPEFVNTIIRKRVRIRDVL